jgi:hypothetical protein
MTEQLVRRGELTSVLAERRYAVQRRLQVWDPDDLLLQSEVDVIEALKVEALIECPVLDRTSAYLDGDPTERVKQFKDFG